MKVNLKIGILGATLAAALVAVGLFGFGTPNANAGVVQCLSTSATAPCALTEAGLYIIGQGGASPDFAGPGHVVNSITGSASKYKCDGETLAGSSTKTARQINSTNFPNTSFLNSSIVPSSISGVNALPLVVIPSGGSIIICINPTGVGGFDSAGVARTPPALGFQYNAVGGAVATGTDACVIPYTTGSGACDDGDLSLDSNDVGAFDQPSCTNVDNDTRVGEWVDDACVNTVGNGTDHLVIPDRGNNLNTVIVRFTCTTQTIRPGGVFPINIQQNQSNYTFAASCRFLPSATGTTITATPKTVEIIPARSNTSHSLILLTITDSGGNPVITGLDVDFKTDRCSIETAGLGVNLATTTTTLNLFLGLTATGPVGDNGQLLNYLNAINNTFSLNTASPATYANWEFSAEAVTPVDGNFDVLGRVITSAIPAAASGGTDLGRTIDGFDNNGDGLPDNSLAGAILGCNPVDAPGATPGVANITACVQSASTLDICLATTVTVIGPPASITVAASPTSLRCGEKSTITATVKDSIGQNVSDHTRVELVTNLGGTIGGQGAVAGFGGPVVPVSSSVGDTFGGVSTGFLITSEVTSGPYEVVATSGGTASTDPGYGFIGSGGSLGLFSGNIGTNFSAVSNVLGGQFSTPPVSAQVTVTCSIPTPVPAAPAPAITAPRTGTGITPPSTGDAGLASSSSASWTLFALGGILALSLAGFATVKAARR